MATLVITTLDDETFDGPETIGAPDGAGLSLREAISLAGSDDTITFDPGLSGGTLALTNGVLVIFPKDNFTIDGDIDDDGSPDITIDAGGNSQHFYLFNGFTNFTIDGLHLTDGWVVGAGGSIALGANDVEIRNSVFSNNESGNGGDGGAISTLAGSNLHLYNTQFLGNSATSGLNNANGGAILNSGDLFIENSRFSSNSAIGVGGAIANEVGATLTILNSTFDTNVGFLNGGAISNYGTANIVNSTFVGNGSILGGAIYGGMPLEIRNSTFTGNYAASAGGAIYSSTNGADFTIANSIIAGNEAGSTDDDLLALNGFTNIGGNIIGSDIYANGTLIGDVSLPEIFDRLGVNGNQAVYSGVLADNGGPVPTVMLNPDGLAINRGDAVVLPLDIFDLDGDLNFVEALPLDARGMQRNDQGVDLGAVELRLTNGATTGADQIVADFADDDIRALDGDDLVDGDGGADTIRGGAGKDTLIGGSGDDKLFSNGGGGRLLGGDGEDSLYGDKQSDIMFGNAGADAFRGRSGNDQLFGGDGNDSLLGHAGEDIIHGDDGNDILDAGRSNDNVYGGEGADTIFGRDGDDLLSGDGGNDLIIGHGGADTLTGNLGDDTLVGNGGNDVFIFHLGDGNDTIETFVGGAGIRDTINLSGFGVNFDSFAEVFAAAIDDGFGNTVIDFGGGDTITLTGVSVADLDQDDFLFT